MIADQEIMNQQTKLTDSEILYNVHAYLDEIEGGMTATEVCGSKYLKTNKEIK